MHCTHIQSKTLQSRCVCVHGAYAGERAQCHLRDGYYAHSSRWTFAASFFAVSICNFLHAISKKDKHAPLTAQRLTASVWNRAWRGEGQPGMKGERNLFEKEKNDKAKNQRLVRWVQCILLYCEMRRSLIHSNNNWFETLLLYHSFSSAVVCSLSFNSFSSIRLVLIKFTFVLCLSRSFSSFSYASSSSSSSCLQGCIAMQRNEINTRIWFSVLSVQQMRLKLRFFYRGISCALRLKRARERDQIGIMAKVVTRIALYTHRKIQPEMCVLLLLFCSVRFFLSKEKKNKTRALFLPVAEKKK